MNNFNDIDCLINKILAELSSLKSERLKRIHMQDYNISVIKKIMSQPKEETQEKAQIKDFSLHTSDNLEIAFYQKPIYSKWRLRRRAKKIFKLQNKIEKGYIAAVDDSMKTIEKIYKTFLEK